MGQIGLVWTPKARSKRKGKICTRKGSHDYNRSLLASIIAAIETGAVSINDTIDIKNGSIEYYDKVMRDSDNKHSGLISVKKAFEISSNVAISRIIFENFHKTPEKFIACLDRMGLTEKTNVDIKGEPNPYIKKPEDKKNWTGITLPWMSIGYELTLTPLQVLTLYNGIANALQMLCMSLSVQWLYALSC